MSDSEPDDRQQEVLQVVLKFLGITAAIALAIGLVTYFVVHSLDLNSSSGTSAGAPVGPVQPLPTTALTPSGSPSDEPTDGLTPDPGSTDTEGPQGPPSALATGDLVLSAAPVYVSAMDKITLTGVWPEQDGVSLMVQRFEKGAWVDFGVQTDVKLGNFSTYVETSHEGANIFRVLDPESGTASNSVTVTVGS